MILGFIIFIGIAFFVVLMYQDSLKEQEEKEQYSDFLKGTNVTLDEFVEERDKIDKKFSENDVLWAIYNKKLLSHFLKKDFGLYRNTLLYMAKMLHKEKRRSEELQFYLKVLYCDLSGKGNNNSTDSKEMLIIPPGVYKNILKLKEYFNENMIDNCFKIKFPFHYCDKEIFTNIVNDIFSEENLAVILDKYLDEMKKEYK